MTTEGKIRENNNAPTKFISTHCDIACISQEKTRQYQYSEYTRSLAYAISGSRGK
jgi:hypothetical protein